MSRTLRTLLSLAIAAVLLAGFLHWGGIGPRELLDTLRRLPPRTYFVALAFHIGIYALRAVRFRQLLPTRVRPAFGSVLAVSAAHNLAAYVLPAKTGEAAFVVYLKGVCGVPGSEGLASLLVSRLLDLAVVIGGIGLASLGIAAAGTEAGEREWLLPLGGALLLVAGFAALLCARSAWLVLVMVFVTRLLRLDRTRLGRRLLAKAEGMVAALRHASSGGRLFGAALLSLPLWLGVFVFYAVLARGLGIGDGGGLLGLVFGSGLATVANLLPINGFAGFGTQDAGWAIGFRLLGVPSDIALSTGIAVHLVQLFNVTLLGFLGHLGMGFVGPARRGKAWPPADDPGSAG